MHAGDEQLLDTLRPLWPNALVLNRAVPTWPRDKDVADGRADIVTVDALAPTNPDLAARVRSGTPLNMPDPATFSSGGATGYTDYPAPRNA
jgi:N-ethylmaleimide reductase